MVEGNKRQAAIIFVIAGVFLVGLLLIGLGVAKQQNKNVASQSNEQPQKNTRQDNNKPPDDTKKQEKPATKPAEQKQNDKPANAASQPPPVPSSGASASSMPQTVPSTGRSEPLPATGAVSDIAIGAFSFTLAAFALLRFRQSKMALSPKL